MRRKRMSDKFVLTKELKRRTDVLPIEQTVYVPSTSGIKEQRKISKKQFSGRVNEVRGFLSKRFGGFTSVEGVGGWLDSEGKKERLVKENVVKVTSFSKRPEYRKHHNELINQLGTWGKNWKQSSIGYEQEGDLFYVKPPQRRTRRK